MPPSSVRRRRRLRVVAIVVALAMVLSLLVNVIRLFTSEPESVGPGDPRPASAVGWRDAGTGADSGPPVGNTGAWR